MFKTIQRIHFVGIGGSGMNGIAEVLLNLGYKVSGSDLKKSDVTERLKHLGAKIFYGHAARFVGDAQVVVTSTAVESSNPEVLFAKIKKIPVIPRIEMLAEIARLKYTVAVAGTHGKTTTTSMIAAVLQSGHMDPTFIVGGKIHKLQSGAKLGRGEFLVAEADESDGSFLKLSPTIAIITNIDNDHLDYYGSMKKLRAAFKEFANRVPFYGSAIICADDAGVKSVLPHLQRRVVTYGLGEGANYSAQEISFCETGMEFNLLKSGTVLGKVNLNLSGTHNVLNALAACACGLELHISFEKVAAALKHFESVHRRLELRSEKNGALWVDDYGHHPTEIAASISALKEKYRGRNLVVLFQPHRFSRTQSLIAKFGQCFDRADSVVLLPIYPAGEKPIPGVSSKNILALLKRKRMDVSLWNGGNLEPLKSRLRPGNVILTLGAGDVWKTGEKLFAP